MSLYIDKMYINFISSRLKNHRWIRNNLAVCSCPMCGDGHRGNKTRFYLYENVKYGSNSFNTNCKNCGYSSSFYTFLKDFDPGVFNDYRLDNFREKFGREPRNLFNESQEDAIVVPETDAKLVSRELVGAVPLSELPDDHPCVLYVRSRLIPEKFMSYLMYTDNFQAMTAEFKDSEYAKKIPSDARLVIPFYSAFGDLETYQGRSLDPTNKMRYITIKKHDGVVKTFGIDRIDRTKDVRVVEGPIDSLFVENCLAAADADLTRVMGDVYIFDAQYRNKDVCRLISKAINDGFKVVLFPKTFVWKDINEAIKDGGVSLNLIERTIKENTFQGLRAKLEFNKLKAVDDNTQNKR